MACLALAIEPRDSTMLGKLSYILSPFLHLYWLNLGAGEGGGGNEARFTVIIDETIRAQLTSFGVRTLIVVDRAKEN